MAGSIRQQTVGRINQAADRGDGDEDEEEDEDKDENGNEDKDENEILNYAVLLTALVERVGLSRMPDLLMLWFTGYSLSPSTLLLCTMSKHTAAALTKI